MTRSLLLALLLTLNFGCAAPVDIPVEEDEGELAADTSVTDVDLAAPSSTVRVRAGVLTVWLDPRVDFEAGVGWTLHGRTSRKLSEVVSFNHDDGFGEAILTSPTSFTIKLASADELNALLAGEPLFVRFVTATGVLNEHQARIVLAPRLLAAGGSPSIRFDPRVTPVADRTVDGLSYRARVLTTQTPRAVLYELEGSPLRATKVSPRAHTFDLSFDDLLELEDEALVVRAQFAATSVTARARVELVISSLGLTTKSAALTWPRAECRPAIDACVATATDLGACGSYQQVHPCVDPRTR
jgi:hypothetical protein